MKKIINSRVLLSCLVIFAFLGACSAAKKEGIPKVVQLTDDWCADCIAMAPVMKEAEEQFKGKLVFETHNIKSKGAKAYEQYFKDRGVDAPFFVFFDKEGKHLATFQGAAPKQAVFDLFEVLIAGKPKDAPAAPPAKDVPKLEDIGQAGKPVIVLHYADWCPYCRKVMPIFDELMKDYEGKVFMAKWNIEDEKQKVLSSKYRAAQGGIPYIEFFDKNGKYVTEVLGYQSKEALVEKIKSSFKI